MTLRINRRDEIPGRSSVVEPDIVEQGAKTLEALAAVLVHASVWFFWWD